MVNIELSILLEIYPIRYPVASMILKPMVTIKAIHKTNSICGKYICLSVVSGG